MGLALPPLLGSKRLAAAHLLGALAFLGIPVPVLAATGLAVPLPAAIYRMAVSIGEGTQTIVAVATSFRLPARNRTRVVIAGRIVSTPEESAGTPALAVARPHAVGTAPTKHVPERHAIRPATATVATPAVAQSTLPPERPEPVAAPAPAPTPAGDAPAAKPAPAADAPAPHTPPTAPSAPQPEPAPAPPAAAAPPPPDPAAAADPTPSPAPAAVPPPPPAPEPAPAPVPAPAPAAPPPAPSGSHDDEGDHHGHGGGHDRGNHNGHG